MATADPTTQFLADLRNPAKYHATRRVAVFRPHKRQARTSDGKLITVEVTPADLKEIAANSNAAYASGHLNPLTLGHRLHDPQAPETAQPPIMGYVGDFRAEVVQRPGGPELVITQTEYVPVDKRHIVAEYPYRSAEYDPDAKVIEGCAALKRRPYLDLGVVPYGGGRRIVHYALESHMSPDGQTPPMGDEDEDEVFYAKFAKAMTRYEAEKAAPPPMPGDLAGKMPYSKGTTPTVNYSAGVEAQLAAMRQQQEAMRRQLLEAQADAMLMPLVPSVRFDYAREKTALVNYQTESQRVEHIKYMQATYQQLPTGSMLPLPGRSIGGPVATSAIDPHKPTDSHEKIMAYMKANPGMSYVEAQAKIVAG